MKAAIIHQFSQKVVNIIELDPDEDYKPEFGHSIMFSEEARIGMVWNGSQFIDPTEPSNG